MDEEKILEPITVNPKILGGKPIIKGRRLAVENFLGMLAAAYAFGIIRNRAFLDGNKRTGFLAAYVFLELNDGELSAPET